MFLFLVENVRGKSGFELTHADVIHSISIWAKEYGLENRVSLLVDHGSVPSGYYVKDKGLCVIFAGKKLKADDIIGTCRMYDVLRLIFVI